MPSKKEIYIRKAENGYILKATIIKEGKKQNVEGMINLMRAMGMYESWQEHKEEEIRRSLEKIPAMPIPEKEEKEIICSSMAEASAFIKNFFEREPDLNNEIRL